MREEQFGPYTLLRRIATGGMGELFLAQRRGAAGFSKLLVVKRLRAELADDGEFVEMFISEGRVASVLDHPNIVHIYELGEVDGAYFMAMEYIAGKHLGAVLHRQKGPLPLAEAIYLLAGVCEGLAFAHEAVDEEGRPLALVHRDVSPPNVLVSYAGAVKVADFGIAKVQAEHHRETRAGVLKGKFGYLSPEQARAQPIDRRTDIYALGLMLFEISTGQRALCGTTEGELLRAAAEGLARNPFDVDANYPKPLEAIYRRATAHNPFDRYPSARHMQEDLLAFQMENRLVCTAGKLAKFMQALFHSEWIAEDRIARTPISHQTAKPWRAPTHRTGPATPAHQRQVHEPTLPNEFDSSTSAPTNRAWPTGPSEVVFPTSQPQPSSEIAEEHWTDASTSLYDGHDSAVEVVGVAGPKAKRQPRPLRKAIGILMAVALPIAAIYLFIANPWGWPLPGKATPAEGSKVLERQASERDTVAVTKTTHQRSLDSGTNVGRALQPDASAPTRAHEETEWRRFGNNDPTPAKAEAPEPDASLAAVATPPKPRQRDPASTPAPLSTGKGGLRIEATPRLIVKWKHGTLGKTPLVVPLPAGRHRLTFVNPVLSIRIRRRVTIRPGKMTHIVLNPRKGLLRIDAPPQTRVTLRGASYGVTPMANIPLYQGLYSVQLANDKLKASHQQFVRIRPGQVTTLPWRIKPLGAPEN